MKAKTRDDFLMFPTVDYCFKELLAYPKIRKGFVAAILNQAPEEIAETTLMPTISVKIQRMENMAFWMYESK